MKKNSMRMSAAVIMLGLCLSAFCAESAEQNQGSSSNTDISLTTDQSQVTLPAETSAASSYNQKQPSTIWVFVRMILVLAIVIACIYAIVYLMKRGMRPGAENDPFLRKVSSITLSPGKSVQIVTLIDHAYVIGVTDNAINLIGTVDDKELIDSMNLYADKNANTKKPRSFADVLDIFMPNGPREQKKTVFDQSAQNTAQTLRKQRGRLNEEENRANDTGEEK
jgi:flagellar protein FliO/FliZ